MTISHRPPGPGAVCLCCYFTPSLEGGVFMLLFHTVPGGAVCLCCYFTPSLKIQFELVDGLLY